MKWLKKDNGQTLLEIVLVSGLVGMTLLLLWTSYLSVNRTHIKASRKVQNLEEACIAINFINDSFQRYEMESCQVIINEKTKELEDGEEGLIKQIIFRNNGEKIAIKYNSKDEIMTFQTQEIGRGITHFTANRHDQLIDFNIAIEKKGKGIVPDQIIEIGTTANLKYR